MNYRILIDVIRRNPIRLAAALVLGIGVAAAITFTQTPIYRSTADVYVSTNQASSLTDLNQGAAFTQQAVKSYANIATSDLVLTKVLSQLRLRQSVESLSKDVTATVPVDEAVINISAVNASSTRASEIANATASALSSVVQDISADSSASDASAVKVTTINAARPTITPISPSWQQNLFLGALIGFVICLVALLLRRVTDTRVRRRQDVEVLTEAPILGAIAFDVNAPQAPLVVQVEPASTKAEGFRSLRANFQFLTIRKNPAVVFTSSIPSEGKSTTASNVALVLADAGFSVALVDADLRKPKIADQFGLEGTVGLTDVLIGAVTLDEALQPIREGLLHVLPAGRVPPNPSELLGGEQMERQIADLRSNHDYVLFDAPPLLPVADAAVLARKTDGALVIAASGTVRKAQLRYALESLDRVQAHVLGIILTKLPQTESKYGYSYQYGDTQMTDGL